MRTERIMSPHNSNCLVDYHAGGLRRRYPTIQTRLAQPSLHRQLRRLFTWKINRYIRCAERAVSHQTQRYIHHRDRHCIYVSEESNKMAMYNVLEAFTHTLYEFMHAGSSTSDQQLDTDGMYFVGRDLVRNGENVKLFDLTAEEWEKV
jgi:hypothetical protein